MSKNKLSFAGASILATLVAMVGAVHGQDVKTDRGEQLYAKNCEACHHVGENIIRPEKTMDRSLKISSKAAFKRFLSRQNGLMPPYLTIVRSDKDLSALYSYVKKLPDLKLTPQSQAAH